MHTNICGSRRGNVREDDHGVVVSAFTSNFFQRSTNSHENVRRNLGLRKATILRNSFAKMQSSLRLMEGGNVARCNIAPPCFALFLHSPRRIYSRIAKLHEPLTGSPALDPHDCQKTDPESL
jgi:hypothetical protein